jgi:RNA polymerase sigma-70 factor (ECF subfamily)
MTEESDPTRELRRLAADGNTEGWGRLLAGHRERLRRMVALRLDHHLQGRIDPSDVIQETYLEAWTRLPEYLRNPSVPFYLWLRFLKFVARTRMVFPPVFPPMPPCNMRLEMTR